MTDRKDLTDALQKLNEDPEGEPATPPAKPTPMPSRPAIHASRGRGAATRNPTRPAAGRPRYNEHPDAAQAPPAAAPLRDRRRSRGPRHRDAAQVYLDRWERRWADTRIHGTTKRQVAAMFAEENRPSARCRSSRSATTSTATAPCIWTAASRSRPPTTGRRRDGSAVASTCSGTTPTCGCSTPTPASSSASTDFVREDAGRLRAGLGAGDRRKLGDYLDSVREVERRIQNAGRRDDVDLPALARPDGVPPTFEEHVRTMSDLIAIAFQADLTRVVSLMYSREGGNRPYRSIGVPDAHHGLSHHQNDPERMARLQLIDQHHVAMFAYLLGKLRDAADGSGSLLDHSMVLYGSSLSDSNAHTHDDLPALLAGGGGGTLRGGRHLRYPDRTPMTNLFVTMLDKLGSHREQVGDSTGRIEHLSEL